MCQIGVSVHGLMVITNCAAIKSVCSEYRIHNADVYMKEDCNVDDLVDVIEGSRVYIPCIYVINKIDQACMLRSAQTCTAGIRSLCKHMAPWHGLQLAC